MSDNSVNDGNAKEEAIRRNAALALVIIGWLGSAFLGLWAVLNFDPSRGDFAPQWVGLGYIFLIGVAVAASTARARCRMADTIVGAFKAGQAIADDRWKATLRAQSGDATGVTEQLARTEAGKEEKIG